MSITDTPILTHYNSRSGRDHFADVGREVVRGERPVVIAPRDEQPWVAIAREQLLSLLAPYTPHLEVVPDPETGEVTIWVEELQSLVTGENLVAARDQLAREVPDDVNHFLARWPILKHTNRAKDYPYILRLALAESRDELIAFLFARYAQASA